MKLQQLKYFKTVCDLGSVSRAAENLFISQSAVSISIKELENEFGVSLFQRIGKRLVLTPEGQRLLELSTRLLEDADEVEQAMENMAGEHRPLRLGVTTMMAAILLPRIYREVTTRCPEIRLQVVEGGRSELMDLMSRQKADVIVVPRGMNDPAEDYYNHSPLQTMEYSYCVNRKHRLAGRQSVTVRDIGTDPLITFREGYTQKQLTKTRFNEQGMQPNIVHSSAQLSTILEMVDKDDMGCFLFRELERLRPDLCFIPFDPPILLQIDLVWRKDIMPTRDEETLIGCILDLFRGEAE